MNDDTIVTLIGVRMAKPGVEFIYRGKSRDCNGCNLKNTCLNLDEGGQYKIVSIRNAAPLDCLIHDGGVQAVDVVEIPWKVFIESSKAYEGSTIIYEPFECDEKDCEMFEMCQHSGPIPGQKYKILKIIGEPSGECIRDISFKIVEMK